MRPQRHQEVGRPPSLAASFGWQAPRRPFHTEDRGRLRTPLPLPGRESLMTLASPYRVVAIPDAVAEKVRATGVSPRYGHPAHAEVAKGYGPCRQCLRDFAVGQERRILFTYDAFTGAEALPLPGP